MKKILLLIMLVAIPFASLKAQGDAEIRLNNNCGYVCDGSLGGGLNVRVFNILEQSVKVIQVGYTLSGANTGSFTQDFTFDFIGNIGTPVDFFVTNYIVSAPNPGLTTITVDYVLDTGASYFIPIGGSKSVDITILPIPNVAGASVSVNPLLCVGKRAFVTVNFPMLPDGATYKLNYSLSGANNVASRNVFISFTGGLASFFTTIPDVANLGSTTITLNSITAGPVSCSDLCVVPITGVNHTFVVNPYPNISGVGGVTVTQPLCVGNSGTALLTASLLANGTYNVKYSLSGSNVSGSTLATAVFVGGVGSFTIPSIQLSNAGGTTIQVEEIINSSSCNSVYTVFPTNNFIVSPRPNTSGVNNMF